MHSKVIVASLVLALAASFSGSLNKNTAKAIAPKQENEMVHKEHDHCCDHDEHDHCCDHEHEQFETHAEEEPCALAPRTLTRKEVRTISGAKYLYLSRGLSETISGTAKWYAFTAPFDGQFNFYSTGNMNPYAELRANANANSYIYASGGTGGGANNFRISYSDFRKGDTYYLRVWELNNTSGQCMIYVSHTHQYVEAAYPMGTSHRLFCSCGAYTTAALNVDDTFSGHGHNMIHCSVCDKWIDITQSGHTHSYNKISYYNSNSHIQVCGCGYATYASHTYDQIIRGPQYDEKHCSVCDTWVAVAHSHNYNQLVDYNSNQHKKVCSTCGEYVLENHNYNNYDPLNMTYHTVSCACGRSYTSAHTYNRFEDYNGHGLNGIAWCDTCGYRNGCYGIYDGGSASYHIDDGDIRFFKFTADETGDYVVESTHTSGDPQLDVYEILSNDSLAFRSEYCADDEKGNGDFIKTIHLEAGQRLLLGLHGYDYYYVGDYTIMVNKTHVHNYTQLVDYNYNQHKRMCSCGEFVLENHSFSGYQSYNRGQHVATCDCGRVRYQQHNFTSFIPYEGHGLNGLVYCPICDASIGCYGIYVDGESSYSLDGGEELWYVFNPQETARYEFVCESNADSFLEIYKYNHTTEEFTNTGLHADDENGNGDFRGIFTLQADPNITYLLKVREYDYEPIEFTIRVAIHEHDYNRLVNYNEYDHKRVCACGDYVLEAHSFGSWQSYTDGKHKQTCACGAVRYEEHNFTSYVPYGHGHNESIFCSDCGEYIELDRIATGESVNGSVAANSAKWYSFQADSNNEFVFEATGAGNTVGELYVIGNNGAVPAQPTYTSDPDDNNLRIQCYLEEGQIAVLRVNGANWGAASYTLSVSLPHVHVFENPVSLGDSGHELICECGETIIEEHNFLPRVVGKKIYNVCTECGYRVLASLDIGTTFGKF